MRRRTFYVLEGEAEGCVAELLLNDQPQARIGDGEGLGRRWYGQVNHEVVPGQNEVTLLVAPGPTPASALRARRAAPGRERRGAPLAGEDPRPARVSCRLVRYLEREVVGSPAGERLVELEWDLPGDAAPRPWPQVVAGLVDLGEAFGRWRWQDAPPLTLDDAATAEVRGFLDELHAALSARDLELLVERSRVRLDEISRAYQLPARKKEQEVRENARFSMGAEGWGMAALPWRATPLPPRGTAALARSAAGLPDLRLCARRRQLDCVARDGHPLVRELPRPPYGLFNTWALRLSRLDGALHIVR